MGNHDSGGGNKAGYGIPGMIEKAATLMGQEVTDADLQAINRYAQTPLTAEEVFVFKAVLCDNRVDRGFERFSLNALNRLQQLFRGKTVIKDHKWAADRQVARIYDTELVTGDRDIVPGEKYTQLVAHCYTVKTNGNTDLIAEIKGGIKREGSIGCSVSRCVCSICGADINSRPCGHVRGRKYEKDGKNQICTFTLDGAEDAYEFSLVAVPAQRAAGVSRSYEGDLGTTNSPDELALRARLAAVRARNIFIN